MTPERIYGWQHGQLSIAKYYGGCTYNGAGYTVDYAQEGHPLVRNDVFKAQAKAKKEASKAKRTKAAVVQESLI